MTVWGDMDHVQLLPLDAETADRLLAGWVAPEDAPPGYGAVVRLLDAASAEAGAEEFEGQRDKVVALALAVCSSNAVTFVSPKTIPRRSTLSHARLVAATLAVVLAATAGLASTGSLPGPAQDIASRMLTKLGTSVPGAPDRAGTDPDVQGRSDAAPSAPSTAGTWSEISELAGWTAATGVEKDAVVATAASRGQSQAGQDGSVEPGSDVPGESGTVPNAPSAAGKASAASKQATDAEATGVQKGAVLSTGTSNSKGQAGQHGSAPGAGNGHAPSMKADGGGTGAIDTARGGRGSHGGSTANTSGGGRNPAVPADPPGAKRGGGGPAAGETGRGRGSSGGASAANASGGGRSPAGPTDGPARQSSRP